MKALEIAWDWFAVNPREAGQIVVHPRFATTLWPHPWSDGTSWSGSQPRCAWTVLARGAVFLGGRDGQPYRSGVLILIDAERKEVFRGICLP